MKRGARMFPISEARDEVHAQGVFLLRHEARSMHQPQGRAAAHAPHGPSTNPPSPPAASVAAVAAAPSHAAAPVHAAAAAAAVAPPPSFGLPAPPAAPSAAHPAPPAPPSAAAPSAAHPAPLAAPSPAPPSAAHAVPAWAPLGQEQVPAVQVAGGCPQCPVAAALIRHTAAGHLGIHYRELDARYISRGSGTTDPNSISARKQRQRTEVACALPPRSNATPTAWIATVLCKDT
eukprot:630548-Pelagomonas_calceolata.AAC.1